MKAEGIVKFILRCLTSKSFWMLTITSFLGILMYDFRSGFKDQVFQDAISSQKKSGWADWDPRARFNKR